MSEKKNFVIRIDSDTYRSLEKWASDEFRSVNGQIEFLLDKALKEAGRKKPSGSTGNKKNKS
ncbi:MAG: Arc family DNA binding domain-containing protein [Flavisolibacter sp.]